MNQELQSPRVQWGAQYQYLGSSRVQLGAQYPGSSPLSNKGYQDIYCKPTPMELERPTLGNEATPDPLVLPPSCTEDGGHFALPENTEWEGGGQKPIGVVDGRLQNTVVEGNIDAVDKVVGNLIEMNTTPSVEGTEKQRHTEGLEKANVLTVMNNKNECTFKRGGMCTQHGVVGTKLVTNSKKWTKLKSGIFGWKQTKITKYYCKMRMLSDGSSDVQTGIDSQSSDSRRGVGDETEFGNFSGISGVDDRGAGANTSESIVEITREPGFG